jgi:predicted nucleotidyltransferase
MQSIETYLSKISSIISSILHNNFIGAYSIGSFAMGGYENGVSDLDVLVVCAATLSEEMKIEITNSTSHKSLTCPAQKLELVVYSVDNLYKPAQFEINFNTGKEIDVDHVCYDYRKEPPHWFIIDKAVAYNRAKTIAGADAKSIFKPIPDDEVGDAIVECIKWHKDYYKIVGNRNVLGNAARALQWAEERIWTTKRSAVQWCADKNMTDVNEIISKVLSKLS